MTDTETAYLRTVYDAVLWLAEELRQRDPKLPLPYYVSEIVYAAETAQENDKVVPGPGYDSPGG
jgi:hypothetical protein